MIKIKKLDDNYVFYKDDIIYENSILKKPLFHGTRMWLANASDEELTKIREESFKIIKVLRDYYENATEEEKNNIIQCLKSLHEVTKYQCLCNGVLQANNDLAMYEYGDLYVTPSFNEAKGFSNHICGELGNYAYVAANAIKKMDIKHDKDVDDAIAFIFDLYDKHHNDERIVLVLFECNIDDLRTENGKKIESWNKDFYLSQTMFGYRVKNVDKYTFYFISEKGFIDL